MGKIQLEADLRYQSEDGQTMANHEYMVLSHQEYYIYPSFVRTLALLERKGIQLPKSIPLESVERITVYEDGQERVIEDRSQIREILPELVSTELDDGIVSQVDDVMVDVKLKKGSYAEFITCTWRGDN